MGSKVRRGCQGGTMAASAPQCVRQPKCVRWTRITTRRKEKTERPATINRRDKQACGKQGSLRYDRSAILLQDFDRTKHEQVGVARGVIRKEGTKENICPHATVSPEQRAAKAVDSNNAGGSNRRGSKGSLHEEANSKIKCQACLASTVTYHLRNAYRVMSEEKITHRPQSR